MDKGKALLLLCCAIPVIAIAGFFFFGFGWRYALFAMVLIFPLLHLSMYYSGKNCCGKGTAAETGGDGVGK